MGALILIKLRVSSNSIHRGNLNMEKYLYDAFISYRHVSPDKDVAIHLQKLLETYKPPKGILCKNVARVKRIFRDESELPTSGDLDGDIKKALDQSRYLIVICSEETKKSKWCLQEIKYFKERHNGANDHILALLVQGDPREVFPQELCYETREISQSNGERILSHIEVEPLAANVTAGSNKENLKKLKTEFLRIAAPILGCKYDDLFRRHQRRTIRKILVTSLVTISIVLTVSAITIYQNSIITETNTRLNEQIRETQEQQLFRTINYAKDLTDKGDRIQAARIIAEAYDRFDLASPNSEGFLNNLEVVMSSTAYYPAFSAYAHIQHDAVVNAACFSDDDQRVATASDDGKAILWDVKSGTNLMEFIHDEVVTAICFAKDYLVTATGNATINFWNLSTGELVYKYENVADIPTGNSDNYNEVTQMTVNMTSNIIVLQGRYFGDSPVYYMSIIPFPWLNGGDEEQFLTMWSGLPIQLSQNGKYMMGQIDESEYSFIMLDQFQADEMSVDGIYTTYDSLKEGMTPTSVNLGYHGEVYIAYDGDDQHKSTVIVFDYVHGRKTGEYVYERQHWDINVHPPVNVEGLIAVEYENFILSYIDPETQSVLDGFYEIDLSELSLNPTMVEYIPNSENIIASRGAFQDITEIYDKGYKIATLESHQRELSNITTSHNGLTILTAANDGSIILHSTVPRKLLTETKEKLETYYGEALADGYISIKNYNTLVNMDSGEEVASFVRDMELVNIHFNSDGTQLIAIDQDEVLLCETQSGTVIQNFEELNSYVSEIKDLSVSSNFKYGAVTDRDKIQVFDIGSGDILQSYIYSSESLLCDISCDGSTLYLLDRISGMLQGIKITDGTETFKKQIKYYGENINKFQVNAETNRFFITTATATDVSEDAYIYNMTTGELLFSLDQYYPSWAWNCSESIQYVLSASEEDGTILWQIPDRKELIEEIKVLGEKRTLTEEERYASGLTIFD